VDRLRGRSSHDYVSRLHLHPEAIVEQAPGGGVLAHRHGRTLSVVPFGPVRVGWEEGWHCPEMGLRRGSQLLRYGAKGKEALFGTVLSVLPGPPPAARVHGGVVRVRHGGRDHARGVP
jgi:hypothetical protein